MVAPCPALIHHLIKRCHPLASTTVLQDIQPQFLASIVSGNMGQKIVTLPFAPGPLFLITLWTTATGRALRRTPSSVGMGLIGIFLVKGTS